MPQTVDVIQLQRLMRSDALLALIDVREWGEFSLGQFLGARNIARGSLEKYLPFVVPDRSITLVLMCDDGRRSALAVQTARQLGYSQVTVLAGGLEEWKRAGGETYGGWSLTGKDYGERLLVEEKIPELTASELHEMLHRGEWVTTSIRDPIRNSRRRICQVRIARRSATSRCWRLISLPTQRGRS